MGNSPSMHAPATVDQSDQSAQPAWVLGGRYRVTGRLGSGGMADVLRAHDELLNRDVAVKVFRTSVDADGETNGAARRELELQSLAQLSHPNLVTLFDGSVAGSDPAFLVLELVDGPNLAARLADGPLPEPMARQLGAQIAGALAYVHAHDLVHRDVKPANILLGTDDEERGTIRSRLSDFGIVRMVGSARMTAADLTIGTASYIAPEQARGEPVGPPADVYALGLVLIEALTGIRSFDGPIQEVLISRLTRSPEIPQDLPHPWPTLLAAMTATDPALRPTAEQVAEALQTGTAPLVAAAPFTGLPTGAQPTSASMPVGAAVLAGAAAPVGLAAAASQTAPVSAVSQTMGVAAAPATTFLPDGAPRLPTAPPPGTVTRGKRRGGGFGPILIAAAVFLAIVVAGGYFLLRSGPSNHGPTDLSPSGSVATHHRAASGSKHSGSRQSAAANIDQTAGTQGAPSSHSASGPAKKSASSAKHPVGSHPPGQRTSQPGGGAGAPDGHPTTSSVTSPSSSPVSSSSSTSGAAAPPTDGAAPSAPATQ